MFNQEGSVSCASMQSLCARDSIFSVACPSRCLNDRDTFLGEKLCEREKEEKGKAICKYLWGEGDRNSLFFPSVGKSNLPFPFSLYSCSQGVGQQKSISKV